MAEKFTVAVRQRRCADSIRWHVDLVARKAARDNRSMGASPDDAEDDSQDADWSIVGTARAWQEVLTSQLNLSVALRLGELRYCDLGDSDPFASEARVAMLAALLGVTSWENDPGTASAVVRAITGP